MKIIQTHDYETLARLAKDVHELHAQKYPEIFKPYHYETFRDYFKQYIYSSDCIFLLVEENNEYIGYAWLVLVDEKEKEFTYANRYLYIQQMSINKEYKGKGYGTKLMEEIQKIALYNDMNRIELEFWSTNDVAKSFYKKNNFITYRENAYKNISVTEFDE